jgi:flagellar motor component MotA
MDFVTIVCILGAFSLVIIATASGGGLVWSWDILSFLIVIVGLFGAILINYSLVDIGGI